MSEDSSGYRPIKRIRQACQNCRRKKARCTGEKPECALCSRCGQSCRYLDDDSTIVSPPAISPGPVKKHHHPKKFRDDEKMNGFSARLATLESQMAEMVRSVRSIERSLNGPRINQKPDSTDQITQNDAGPKIGIEADVTVPSAVLNNQLPPPYIVRTAADLYFRYCHNQPYSLFHEGSLRNKIELNELPKHLLLALVASTVRYSSDLFFSDKNAAVSAYAHQSWKAIVMPWNGIQSDAELSIVQTILLLAIIDYTDGRTQASWIKVGLAIRLAQDFRMMVEPDQNLSPIQQDERRRVFWSFYLCDKLISCGQERPAAILDEHCKLALPGGESEWRAGQYQHAPTLEQLLEDDSGTALNTLSPFAVSVVMASLLGRCAQYALGEQEDQAPGGRVLPWNPRSKHSSIHSAILQHESELGLNEPLSTKVARICLADDGSIDQHKAAPLTFSRALFYLCQCLLYNPFLLKRRLAHVGQRTPQSFLAQNFVACRTAASSLSRLMDDVKSLCCSTLTTSYDPFYGYCNMVAGVVHALFLEDTEAAVREMAGASLEVSLENLKELSCFWNSCAMMKTRLEEFCANRSRYAALVDPTAQELGLTPSDANDLAECLDYARISTPRCKTQQPSRTAAPADPGALSHLPSPYFEELMNLLPFTSSRPVSPPRFDGLFVTESSAFDGRMNSQNPSNSNFY
ncbi:uncharacterized protein N7498_005498 [Penicillium cinerascens]|uniref:Zn(2)-C6 fungal-type domain-containing protein n=1 Tax=Penicillium cinerascens TaxID=70096 RepID=A0A9W9T083_9EURO|nr:uncharacterized protein N7498_005498 [Penicillium cinerascens]KAJ5204619.1 hypothetical protein N7498_005498 [Penicillium cinerascens]